MEKSKFTEIDEEFICDKYRKKVPKLGYSCRNHCPYCLHSKHVDINPGDRAEQCHGDLEPIGLEINGKKGDLISLIPISTTVNGINTNGLEYPLTNATMTIGKSLGVSNVLEDIKANISIKDGYLLVIKSKD